MGEVIDLIEAFTRAEERKNRIREANLKDQLQAMYIQAIQIGEVMARVLDNKNNEPLRELSDFYPNLFPRETEEPDDGLTPELRRHKAGMENFAYRYNMAFAERKRREAENRGETDGRSDT